MGDPPSATSLDFLFLFKKEKEMHGRHCSIVIYYKENIIKLMTHIYGQAKGNFALVGG